jgi:hypothetical protein
VLKPGVHLLEWIYSKDVSLSGGLDAAWLDQVTFPDISFLEADLHIDSVFAPPAQALLSDVSVKGRVINFGRTALTSFRWHTESMTGISSTKPSTGRLIRVTLWMLHLQAKNKPAEGRSVSHKHHQPTS